MTISFPAKKHPVGKMTFDVCGPACGKKLLGMSHKTISRFAAKTHFTLSELLKGHSKEVRALAGSGSFYKSK
jgi:hypothetical protein